MDGPYQVVFDLRESGFKAWPFPTFGLIFVVIGLLFVRFPNIFRVWPWSEGGLRIFGWLFFAFSVMWTGGAFWATYGEYRSLVDRFARGEYQVTEGTIGDYERDRTAERFRVNGVPFEYSDSTVTSAFNNTAAEGGPVRPGLHVRITHADGKILRLEIRK